MLNIVNVGYDSTNYYVIANPKPVLLIDLGFPQTLPKLMHTTKRMGIELRHIPYLLCTHYHPDHAGAAGELQALGVGLIVVEEQRAFVHELPTHIKPDLHFKPPRLPDAGIPDNRPKPIIPRTDRAGRRATAHPRTFRRQRDADARPGSGIHRRSHSADDGERRSRRSRRLLLERDTCSGCCDHISGTWSDPSRSIIATYSFIQPRCTHHQEPGVSCVNAPISSHA